MCQNHTMCVEITLVCFEITVVSIVITFVRVKITMRVETVRVEIILVSVKITFFFHSLETQFCCKSKIESKMFQSELILQ
jgi:uncharacterized membrane protein YGL010W